MYTRVTEEQDIAGAAVPDASRTAGGEDVLWTQFVSTSDAETFCQSWLTLQCQQIDGAAGGLVLLGTPNVGPFTPAAVWPADGRKSMEHLSASAEHALRERRGVVEKGLPEKQDTEHAQTNHLAYPLEFSSLLHGVVVVEVMAMPHDELQGVLRQIHWGIAWLEVLFRRESELQESAIKKRIVDVLDLVAVVAEDERFQAACTSLVTGLATKLECDRVTIGFRRRRQIRVQAMSHSATFGREMNLVRLLEEAMDEAVDQECPVTFPHHQEDTLITRAHEELARQQGSPEICTIPIPVHGEFSAVLTLERPQGQPFQQPELDFCETLGGVVCPTLLLKREQERWLIVKAGYALTEQMTKLLGPSHLVRKTWILAFTAVVAFFSFATGEYRISTDTVVEGDAQRAVVAPFNGYIADAAVRAGDIVESGALLASLDDRDLKLERVNLVQQRAQYIRERREAVAEHKRAKNRILSAQIRQTDAQLRLVEEQLARTRLHAPFDGILVSGDLSQSLGAPVQRGDLLFEIAPLGQYRVILEVDERDIGDVSVGQRGVLVLSALPDTKLPFVVSLITPVTNAEEGRNYFRVEAELQEEMDRLRPGMEGVGKILVGERKLIWIWTRNLTHWMKLKLWAWWP